MIMDIISLIMSGFSVIISIIALCSNIKTGNKQVEIREFQKSLQERQVAISQMQADFQNKVELYLLSQPITLKSTDKEIPDKVLPAIYIRNIGANVIYLEKYLFNGREYPLGKEVLPPASSYDGFRYIFLPTDETVHVSFEIKFRDWRMQKWKTTGYADFKNGMWVVTYSPCEKRGSKK